MTRNQIEYWKLQETQRSNLEYERQGREQLAETKRSNLARETETNRSNLARETETHRANLMHEYQVDLQRRQDAYFTLRNQIETNRSNLAQEKIAKQRNDEQHRTNVANENIRLIQALTNQRQAELQQQQIYVQRNEQYTRQAIANATNRLGYAQLAETSYANRQSENLRQQQIAESIRSNMANEYIRTFANQTSAKNLNEVVRHNQATEAETKRNNLASNAIKAYEVSMKSLSDILRLNKLNKGGKTNYGEIVIE